MIKHVIFYIEMKTLTHELPTTLNLPILSWIKTDDSWYFKIQKRGRHQIYLKYFEVNIFLTRFNFFFRNNSYGIKFSRKMKSTLNGFCRVLLNWDFVSNAFTLVRTASCFLTIYWLQLICSVCFYVPLLHKCPR